MFSALNINDNKAMTVYDTWLNVGILITILIDYLNNFYLKKKNKCFATFYKVHR